MKQRLLVIAGLLGLFVSSGLWGQATTYTYTGQVYTSFSNFAACATGPCANYPPGSRITGQFTTAAPLASNLAVGNKLPLVTSFAFNNGIHTLASANPNVRASAFSVGTDASGNISIEAGYQIGIEFWQSGSSPHAAGDRLALINISALSSSSFNNASCNTVAAAPLTAVPDSCNSVTADGSSSNAIAAAPGVWKPGPAVATYRYSAALSGANENPAVISPGTGSTHVTLDTTAHTLRVSVTFSGLTSNTTAAHIDCCIAPPGNAGVATTVPAFADFPLGATSGNMVQTYDTTLASTWNPAFVTANGGTPAGAEAALAAGLATGQAYLNIHTNNFAAGEVRGVLVPSDYNSADCAQVLDTLNIHWRYVSVPAVNAPAGCTGIETTNGTLTAAATGTIAMAGVSASGVGCIAPDVYQFTSSPDKTQLVGHASGPVPMTLTRRAGEACFVGHYTAGPDDYVAHIAAGPFVNCALDLDGDGTVDALSDGLLLVRAMFGLTGTSATNGTINAGATRTTWPQIQSFLNANCRMNVAP